MSAEAAPAEASRWAAEAPTVAALRAGDERAFRCLFERAQPMMRRVARTYVASDAVAEEIVQETWMAILTGIGRFQGRSALDTWIFSILTKQAKTHRARERRALPFSELEHGGPDAPAVDADRFQVDGDARPGRWAIPPRPWQRSERRLLSLETREHVRRALAQLPERQRLVVALRDVDGLSAAEVSTLLEITPANQRVLLHRARSRLRAALETYLDRDEVP